MNNKVKLIFLLIVITIFFIAFNLYNININININNKENFTPYINGLVRPHIRNVQKYSDSFSNNTNTFFRKMIRKSGLYY